jgi:hypothetical protein
MAKVKRFFGRPTIAFAALVSRRSLATKRGSHSWYILIIIEFINSLATKFITNIYNQEVGVCWIGDSVGTAPSEGVLRCT